MTTEYEAESYATDKHYGPKKKLKRNIEEDGLSD
jgi:hypothetical protein